MEKLKKFLAVKSNLAFVILFFVLAIAYIIGFFNERFSYIAIGGLFLFIAVESFVKSIGFYDDIKEISKANNEYLENIMDLIGKLNNEIHNSEVTFFHNDLSSAFLCAFTNCRHIKKLRLFASSTATILPKIFDEPDLTIDECIILLRKSAGSHQTFSEASELQNSGVINRWKAMVSEGKILKLKILFYQRESDLWYVICDEYCLLTDLFIPNKTYFPYAMHQNRGLMYVSSVTNSGKKYIKRYIDQFDNYVISYQEMNGILLEIHHND